MAARSACLMAMGGGTKAPYGGLGEAAPPPGVLGPGRLGWVPPDLLRSVPRPCPMLCRKCLSSGRTSHVMSSMEITRAPLGWADCFFKRAALPSCLPHPSARQVTPPVCVNSGLLARSRVSGGACSVPGVVLGSGQKFPLFLRSCVPPRKRINFRA